MINSKKYLNKINKYKEYLEKEKLNIESKISEKQKNISIEKENLDNLIKEKNKVTAIFNIRKKILLNKGVIFTVENKYGLKQWDNLFLKKKEKLFWVVDKNGRTIHIMDQELSEIIRDFLKENIGISVLVIREDKRTLFIQLRFIID